MDETISNFQGRLDVEALKSQNKGQAFHIRYDDTYYVLKASLAIAVEKQLLNGSSLQLTEDLIKQNPSDYTAWKLRYDVQTKNNSDLKENGDIRFCKLIVTEFSGKNYQLWNYRRKMSKLFYDSGLNLDEEFDFCRWCLGIDAKNIHAWTQLQALITFSNKYNGEMQYANTMIIQDQRNNTAWNQKYFLVEQLNKLGDTNMLLLLDQEYSFAGDMIIKIPYNPSSWSYLKGLLLLKGSVQEKRINCLNFIFKTSIQVLQEYPSCSYALEGLLIYYYAKVEVLKTAIIQSSSNELLQQFQFQVENCNQLLCALQAADSQRSQYWKNQQDALQYCVT